MMAGVLLAEDLGYGVQWLVNVLVVAIVVTTGFLIYVVLTTRGKHAERENKSGLKYKLFKYHAERYWAIFVAGVLIWLWFLGLPWMPPVAFEKALEGETSVHIVNVTAGQWFWQFKDGGIATDATYKKDNLTDASSMIMDNHSSGNNSSHKAGGQDNGQKSSVPVSNPLKIKVGETVKFVATSKDVNHGFGVLRSSKSMDSPLMQMQVIPGMENIFYYTFKEPGTYTIRCLEYCGWNHPYMVSQITVVSA